MAKATIIFIDKSTNQKKSKKITIPDKRFSFGIIKQRTGFVVIGGFTENPRSFKN